MSYDIKKHRLLKFLYKIKIEYEAKPLEYRQQNDKYIDYLDIPKSARLKDINRIELIMKELRVNEEIHWIHTSKGHSFAIDSNGIISLSNKKYFKRYWGGIFKSLFNLSQVLIPLAALGITYWIAKESTKDDIKQQIEIDTLENKVRELSNTVYQQNYILDSLVPQIVSDSCFVY